jgi:hypothetical protein
MGRQMSTGEEVEIVVAIVAGLLACWFVVSLPLIIAKARGASEEDMATIWLLIILAVFFGLTWFIALHVALTCSSDK